MIRYAVKSLIQDKSKLLLSILGVAVAILLILIMDGIFAGTEEQLTVYIDKTPADIFVMQDGVKNMHMARTIIPAAYKKSVEEINGVKKVAEVDYVGSNIKVVHKDIPVYSIGWDQEADLGGPWSVVRGKKTVARDEVIIDDVIAKKHDIKMGDKLTILGKDLKVVGTTEGTFSMVSSIFFMNKAAFKGIIPANTVSFLLVQTEKGADVKAVADRINDKLKSAHALTKVQFAKNERNIAKKMGVEVIQIMTLISILAAIGIVALSIYSATIEKIRDFGVLKAIGAGKGRLYSVVISQALFSTIIATLIGALLSLGLAGILRVSASEILVLISWASLIKAMVLAIFIGVLAAYLPVRQISGIDPAIVFKG